MYLYPMKMKNLIFMLLEEKLMKQYLIQANMILFSWKIIYKLEVNYLVNIFMV